MKNADISALRIARFLGGELIGGDLIVRRPASLGKAAPHTLCFITKPGYADRMRSGVLYLVPRGMEIANGDLHYIRVDRPRLAFAKTVEKFFVRRADPVVESSAVVSAEARLGNRVAIGPYSVIGEKVEIGEGTIIGAHVRIAPGTRIGRECLIRSGSVIGEEGFGFDFEADGTPVRLPHLGGVVIGDRVEIGAKCTVARGTLDDTVIADDVKIDDQVHIAHNCVIGSKTLITACAELSGSVHVGEKCWIGPNAAIMQKLRIGDGALIGLGAVVTADVAPGRKIMGLGSSELRALVRFKKQSGYPG